MSGALLRYRVRAYIVGVFLIVLVFAAVPLNYLADNRHPVRDRRLDTRLSLHGVPGGGIRPGCPIQAVVQADHPDPAGRHGPDHVVRGRTQGGLLGPGP